MQNDLIPKQEQGGENNNVYLVNLSDQEEALRRFAISRKRLLDIANWYIIAKGPSSEFSLTDGLGNEVRRPAQVDDHIKINPAGLGSLMGGGNDWVKIERIVEHADNELDEDLIVMTVRPSANPLNAQADIAHFFDDQATNTFLLMRRQTTLLAAVYGRNGVPNDDGGLLDNIRNKIVALSDMAGFINPQWKNLIHGLLDISTNFLPEPATVLSLDLKDDGVFPNSTLPALVYKNVIELVDDDSPQVVEELFDNNGWTNSWRNGILDVHHYHSTTHEVLGVYSGSCQVRLGGDNGEDVQLESGDVVIIPAGVAHRNMGQSADFKCVGAYPEGKDYDMNYGNAGERPGTDRHIAAVPLPRTDPVYGGNGLLFKYWK